MCVYLCVLLHIYAQVSLQIRAHVFGGQRITSTANLQV